MNGVPTRPYPSWVGSAMQRLRLTRIDVALVTATVVSAVLVAYQLVPQPVHGLLAVGVLVGAPAAAMGRAIGLTDALSAFVAGVAFALAALILISTTLLYLQRWSGAGVLALVAALTCGLVVVSSRRGQP